MPSFSATLATMLTHSGGIYCSANIRGGGEFGEEWHKAAIREKRHVAFTDFEECGRYLIREGWTRKEKLVCQGGSNGGALIGAVMNRAGEELFAAGIAQAGYLPLVVIDQRGLEYWICCDIICLLLGMLGNRILEIQRSKKTLTLFINGLPTTTFATGRDINTPLSSARRAIMTTECISPFYMMFYID
jgi:hypothetical protein